MYFASSSPPARSQPMENAAGKDSAAAPRATAATTGTPMIQLSPQNANPQQQQQQQQQSDGEVSMRSRSIQRGVLLSVSLAEVHALLCLLLRFMLAEAVGGDGGEVGAAAE